MLLHCLLHSVSVAAAFSLRCLCLSDVDGLFSLPSVDCLRLRLWQASFQWPRPKPPRIGFYTNYLSTDGLFLRASAEKYRHAVSATAVMLSDRIVRLSDLLVFHIRHYKPPRSFTKHGRFAGNGQARLVAGQIVAAAETERGAK